MGDLRALRERYVLERPHWEKVARAARAQLQQAVRRARVGAARVTCRCKDVPSLLRKAVLKERIGDLGAIRDKAGARVTVAVENDIDAVVQRILDATEFDVRKIEDTAEGYSPEVFDYRGVHLDVVLPRRLVPDAPSTIDDLWCEVQVRTQAQTLWADTAHPMVYKGPIEPPDETKRAIHRLMALVELYDLETSRARMNIANAPAFAVGKIIFELERMFFSLVASEHDPETSQIVVAALLPLYNDATPEEILERLETFVQDRREDLLWTYEHYADDDERVLLFQPESIMIFERLEADRYRLMEQWQEHLTPDLLEEIATVWRAPY